MQGEKLHKLSTVEKVQESSVESMLMFNKNIRCLVDNNHSKYNR